MVGSALKGSLCACLLGLALTCSAGVMAAKPNVHLAYLPSGKQIAILALGPAAADGGKTKAIMLRYRTTKSTSDRDALSREADDVWDLFKIDADRSGFNTAVISAEVAPHLASGQKETVNFILTKDTAGNWNCSNDKIVTVGTPAKVAYRQGLKLYTQGRIPEALVSYTKSISLDPAYVQAYVDRAALYISINQLEKSLADSDKAVGMMPANAGAYCNRGIVNEKLGQYQDAIDDCTASIQLNPEQGLNYAYRGIAYTKLGQYDKAVDDLNRAFSLKVQLGEAYYCRSVALDKIAKGDRVRAVELGYQAPEGKTTEGKAVAQRPERRRSAR